MEYQGRQEKAQKSAINLQAKSAHYTQSSRFLPPTHPAYVISSNFQSQHIADLQEECDKNFIAMGMQTGKKKLMKIPETPNDRYFIIVDDSKGKPKLQGEFQTLNCKIIHFPVAHNKEQVIEEFKKYVGLGHYEVDQEYNQFNLQANKEKSNNELLLLKAQSSPPPPSTLNIDIPQFASTLNRPKIQLREVSPLKQENRTAKGKLFIYLNRKDNAEYRALYYQLQTLYKGNPQICFIDRIDEYNNYIRLNKQTDNFIFTSQHSYLTLGQYFQRLNAFGVFLDDRQKIDLYNNRDTVLLTNQKDMVLKFLDKFNQEKSKIMLNSNISPQQEYLQASQGFMRPEPSNQLLKLEAQQPISAEASKPAPNMSSIQCFSSFPDAELKSKNKIGNKIELNNKGMPVHVKQVELVVPPKPKIQLIRVTDLDQNKIKGLKAEVNICKEPLKLQQKQKERQIPLKMEEKPQQKMIQVPLPHGKSTNKIKRMKSANTKNYIQCLEQPEIQVPQHSISLVNSHLRMGSDSHHARIPHDIAAGVRVRSDQDVLKQEQDRKVCFAPVSPDKSQSQYQEPEICINRPIVSPPYTQLKLQQITPTIKETQDQGKAVILKPKINVEKKVSIDLVLRGKEVEEDEAYFVRKPKEVEKEITKLHDSNKVQAESDHNQNKIAFLTSFPSFPIQTDPPEQDEQAKIIKPKQPKLQTRQSVRHQLNQDRQLGFAKKPKKDQKSILKVRNIKVNAEEQYYPETEKDVKIVNDRNKVKAKQDNNSPKKQIPQQDEDQEMMIRKPKTRPTQQSTYLHLNPGDQKKPVEKKGPKDPKKVQRKNVKAAMDNFVNSQKQVTITLNPSNPMQQKKIAKSKSTAPIFENLEETESLAIPALNGQNRDSQVPQMSNISSILSKEQEDKPKGKNKRFTFGIDSIPNNRLAARKVSKIVSRAPSQKQDSSALQSDSEVYPYNKPTIVKKQIIRPKKSKSLSQVHRVFNKYKVQPALKDTTDSDPYLNAKSRELQEKKKPSPFDNNMYKRQDRPKQGHIYTYQRCSPARSRFSPSNTYKDSDNERNPSVKVRSTTLQPYTQLRQYQGAPRVQNQGRPKINYKGIQDLIDLTKYDRVLENGIVVYRSKYPIQVYNYSPSAIANKHTLEPTYANLKSANGNISHPAHKLQSTNPTYTLQSISPSLALQSYNGPKQYSYPISTYFARTDPIKSQPRSPFGDRKNYYDNPYCMTTKQPEEKENMMKKSLSQMAPLNSYSPRNTIQSRLNDPTGVHVTVTYSPKKNWNQKFKATNTKAQIGVDTNFIAQLSPKTQKIEPRIKTTYDGSFLQENVGIQCQPDFAAPAPNNSMPPRAQKNDRGKQKSKLKYPVKPDQNKNSQRKAAKSTVSPIRDMLASKVSNSSCASPQLVLNMQPNSFQQQQEVSSNQNNQGNLQSGDDQNLSQYNQNLILYLIDKSLPNSLFDDLNQIKTNKDSLISFKNQKQLSQQLPQTNQIYDIVYIISRQVTKDIQNMVENHPNWYLVELNEGKTKIKGNRVTVSALKYLKDINQLLLKQHLSRIKSAHSPSRVKSAKKSCINTNCKSPPSCSCLKQARCKFCHSIL